MMNHSLTPDQISTYNRDGILFPIRIMTREQAASLLNHLETIEAHDGGQLKSTSNQKPHLLFPWLSELARNPAIIDAVSGILGPNLLCWASSFFIKNPGDGTYISWHQDSTYWDLSSPDVLTAWIALTPSTPESGCMRVIPGTHLKDQVPHRDTFAHNNLLSRGQEIAVEVDENKAVDVVLQPGEMSLHHVRIFHGSKANQSTHRRVGFSIRYIPTRVSQISGRTSALLVSGVDEFGHFDPEPTPSVDFDPRTVEFHREAIGKITSIVLAGANAASKLT
jgi:non-haem Fe2+, alpha-ketoglutarate-dependent halogenase